MDLEEETQAQTKVKSQINFTISEKGEVDFKAQGLNEWQLTEALGQVKSQVSQAQSARKQMKVMAIASELALHGVAFMFLLTLVLTLSFSITYTIRSMTTFNNESIQQ